MTTTEDKMYAIAKHYNYLNDRGKVKAIKGNEKGYAKIREIVRGCSLFLHHMNDDKLTIDLMISPAAKSRYELACNKAVDTFKNHFQTDVKFVKWGSSMPDAKVHDRYFVDVSKIGLPELMIMIEKAKNKFASV